jgi:recombination protein RecA
MTEEDRQQAIWQKLARMEMRRAAPPLSTGLRTLDVLLGGGLPRGGIAEWFGPPSCGKTTLALEAAAHIQKNGALAAWIDADRTFDPGYAAALGVSLERLPVVRPESAEEAMEMARQLLDSGALDLLVVDSAAALVSRLELDAPIAEGVSGVQSRVLSSRLRGVCLALRRRGAAALFLNQNRVRPDGTAGEMETSAGGPALKLYASVRLTLQPADSARLRLRVVKNNLAEAFSGGVLAWREGGGFADPL